MAIMSIQLASVMKSCLVTKSRLAYCKRTRISITGCYYNSSVKKLEFLTQARFFALHVLYTAYMSLILYRIYQN